MGQVRRRQFLFALGAGSLSVSLSALAQQQTKVPRIGILRFGSPPDPLVDAFRQGLRDLGYIEGQNIAIEYRWAEGKPDRLPGLAAELARLKVDVIVPGGHPPTRAAIEATSTIPIVMAVVSDPVADGFVTSLARPGRNVTGLSLVSPELTAKRLELLKLTFPKISRVAVFWEPANDARQFDAAKEAAHALGVVLQSMPVPLPKDFEEAFSVAQKERVDALIVLSSALIYDQRARLADVTAKYRLPAIYEHRAFVEAGGLMSYGTNLSDLFRRAAVYVDKIIKGAKPGDLPVEQPTKFELFINMKTARALGVTIPQSILLRADRVIE